MLYYLFIAFFMNIDSLGIGISYGLKNTKFTLLPNLIVTFVSLVISSTALLIGKGLAGIFPDTVSNAIGCIILAGMGLWIIFHPTDEADFDDSNSIDKKEALFLGLALSLDSIGVGIGLSSMGYASIWFPIFNAIFNLIFLNMGKLCGKHIKKRLSIPDFVWNLLAGTLLIGIGIFRFF